MSNMHEHGFSVIEYVRAIGLLAYLGFIIRDVRLLVASKLKPTVSAQTQRNRCTPSSRNDLSGLC